ncbi:hypothetical protein BJX99DRAFT_268361 [Aspergillus californicus]
MAQETVRPVYDTQALPLLSYGLQFDDACARHVRRLGCTSVYVLLSRSLATKTDAWTRLQTALEPNIAGSYVGIRSHTPISQLVQVLAEIRSLPRVDCIITLGGGSVTDAGKLVRFALANAAYDKEAIDTLWGGHSKNPNKRAHILPPTLPLIHIPTSLSGGEYQHIAGAVEDYNGASAKRTFEPGVNPTLVIQDPQLSLHTPAWLWLSSGVRAVDHCVETLCSLLSNARGDAEAERGLRELVPGLLQCKKDGGDLHARHRCQMGVVGAMAAVSSGVPLGASHAIGHQLGPLGVGHGETSCILLPAVCKYNAARGANNERQAFCRGVLLEDLTVREVLTRDGAGSPDLGDVLDLLIRELGMPRTLRAVNVGRDQLDVLAENSLQDLWIRTNAVPLTEKAEVLEILEAVVG